MKLPDIAFLHELADAADQQTLPRFRSSENLAISTKPKEGFRFDPVTLADREAEKAMRDLIAQRYPTHAVMGEEFGLKAGDERAPCWVLDPIDGTRPFLCGLPVWGTLIGLLHHDRAVMGMMSQPFTGERFYADGSQSWAEGPYGKVRLQTRRDIPLDQAILHTTSPESLGQTSLKFSMEGDRQEQSNDETIYRITRPASGLCVIAATDEEIAEHESRLDLVMKKGGSCLWRA